MKRNNIIKYLFVLFGLSQIASCNSWLDVPSTDRIMENVAFGSRSKFLSTLNGVYVEMASSNLYGMNLSYGMMDVMGQYYCIVPDHSQRIHSTYSYADKVSKSTMDDIWSKAYNMTINCNTIIEKCDQIGEEILGSTLTPIVKGEALALRAMFHFDILRLFGPIYSESTKDVECIPYSTKSYTSVSPLESAESIATKIIADLKAAELLLANDPVITEGPRNYDGLEGSNDYYYRQYRLNYFAVKALLARVNLWIGNKSEAFKYAKEVIDACQPEGVPVEDMLFPPVDISYATHSKYPDRVFSSEVLFSLYHIKRDDLFKNSFSYNLKSTSILNFAGTFSEGRISELYSDQNDYRYKMWVDKVVDDKPVNYCTKYEGVAGDDYWSTAQYRYMIPLIRLGEIYLIAAECSTDIKEGVKYVNKLRLARNCSDIDASSESELQTMILSEFRREMLGEGQMFFMYKRLAMENIPDGAQPSGNKNMNLGSYVVPLPDSETSQREDKK